MKWVLKGHLGRWWCKSGHNGKSSTRERHASCETSATGGYRKSEYSPEAYIRIRWLAEAHLASFHPLPVSQSKQSIVNQKYGNTEVQVLSKIECQNLEWGSGAVRVGSHLEDAKVERDGCVLRRVDLELAHICVHVDPARKPFHLRAYNAALNSVIGPVASCKHLRQPPSASIIKSYRQFFAIVNFL